MMGGYPSLNDRGDFVYRAVQTQFSGIKSRKTHRLMSGDVIFWPTSTPNALFPLWVEIASDRANTTPTRDKGPFLCSNYNSFTGRLAFFGFHT